MPRSTTRLSSFRSALIVASCSAVLLTGCGFEKTVAPSADFVPTSPISGTVHGGSQPILGAKVYLLAVNPTGYGGPGIAASGSNASVSLLTPVAGSTNPDSIGYYATTNTTNGGFNLSATGVYSCLLGYNQGSTVPTVTLSGTEQVYLYILGGTPQNASGANASSGMLVALGPCNSPSRQVTVNEVTTVATAYAFAGFATDATHIGSSGTPLALTGLSNAFANVGNLASVATGSASAGSSAITPPTANLISIADILAACVNGTTANAACGTLFSYTESAGKTGTKATDTATAAINLAHNPQPTTTGMTKLFGLIPGTGAPFAGGLSSQPNDFTLGLQLLGGNLSAPLGLAIDGSGNAWVANYGYTSQFVTVTGYVSEFSSAGVALSGSSSGFGGGGISHPNGLAIDNSGDIWITNDTTYNLVELSDAGLPLSGSNGYVGGGFQGGGSNATGVAIDAAGNVWIGNANVGVSKFTNLGAPVSPSTGYTGGGAASPLYVALDIPGNLWAGNVASGAISEFSNSGSPQSGSSGYSDGNPYGYSSVAIDASGNVWVPSAGNNSLHEYSSAGSPISGSSFYRGGGLSLPLSIAIDGSGAVWAANSFNGSGISEFSSAGAAITGSTGYTGGVVAGYSQQIAIDGSGNVWVTAQPGGGYTLTEFIGAATPLVTPIAANLVTPYGSHAVNRP